MKNEADSTEEQSGNESEKEESPSPVARGRGRGRRGRGGRGVGRRGARNFPPATDTDSDNTTVIRRRGRPAGKKTKVNGSSDEAPLSQIKGDELTHDDSSSDSDDDLPLKTLQMKASARVSVCLDQSDWCRYFVMFVTSIGKSAGTSAHSGFSCR